MAEDVRRDRPPRESRQRVTRRSSSPIGRTLRCVQQAATFSSGFVCFPTLFHSINFFLHVWCIFVKKNLEMSVIFRDESNDGN